MALRGQIDSLSHFREGCVDKAWKVALTIIGTLWAVIAVAAAIPAHEAMSNLQSWADLLGLTYLGSILAAKGVDYIAILSALLGAVVSGILLWHARQVEKEAQEAARHALEEIQRINMRPPALY